MNMGLYHVNHMSFLAFLKAFLNTPNFTHLVLENEHIFLKEQMYKKDAVRLFPFSLHLRSF